MERLFYCFFFATLACQPDCLNAIAGEPLKLQLAPTPADNPLKGLVPYADAEVKRFPHSLEFDYVRLAELVTGIDTYDWKPLEDRLNKISSRGCQAVIRVWIEYPNQKSGVPQFLIDQGVKLTTWTNKKESPPTKNITPDYEDERLVSAVERFLAEFGKRYDGDPRLGFLTAGLLGEWGEWHDWPREDLFASKKTQQRILEAYEKGFKKTHILLRYPAGDKNDTYVVNSNRPFGFHDDSFAWGTLDTGKPDDSWFYMSLLKNAGPDAINKWKSHPIGGEIRPEVWGQIFDSEPSHKQAQDFSACVQQTHASWVMDSGMFGKKQSKARMESAVNQVRKMGYDFYVATALIERRSDKQIEIALTVVNNGVAPFYCDWRMELATLGENGTVLKSFAVDWKLSGILPSDKPTVWTCKLLSNELPNQARKLALRTVNPLTNGKPLHFANTTQDSDAKGWLTLGNLPE